MSDNILSRERFQLMEAVKKGEGGFDLEAFHAMDQRDNALVEQELLHGAGSKSFVYNFEVQGKAVAGVSVIGARHLAATYGGIKHHLIGSMQKIGSLFTFTSYPQPGIPMNMQCAVLPELADEPDFYAAVVEVTDIKQGNTIQVERRELRWEKRRDGTKYERPMYATIAQSKAYRNAILALVPQDILLKWKVEMLAIGNAEGVTADAIAEKRAGILRYAAAKAIPVDRRAIEDLTYDQIAGLSDAVREDKAGGFKAAAEALGILAKLGVTQEQMPQRQKPKEPPPPTQQQQGQTGATGPQAPSVDGAGKAFEAFILGADGEPVDGEAWSNPFAFMSMIADMVEKDPGSREALMEHNADSIAEAADLSENAKQILVTRLQATYTGEDLEQPVPVPVVRGKQSWSGWVAAMKEALPAVDGPGFLPFLEANRRSLENALFAYRLQALRAIHNRSVALGISLPTWAPGLTDDTPVQEGAPTPTEANVSNAAAQPEGPGAQHPTDAVDNIGTQTIIGSGHADSNPDTTKLPTDPPTQDGKPDPDAIWEQNILAALGSTETPNEVALLGRYQTTQTVMARLKREQPERWKRVFDAFDARMAELKAGKGQGNVASPGQE